MSPVFAEAFAKGNIKCCMARQVIWPIPVKKARAVANIPETQLCDGRLMVKPVLKVSR
jgi:hypothetical protein